MKMSDSAVASLVRIRMKREGIEREGRPGAKGGREKSGDMKRAMNEKERRGERETGAPDDEMRARFHWNSGAI